MAKEHGLAVAGSFNTNYDEYLPQAIGNVILIETHNGIPIVEIDVLEKYFPDASKGLHNSDGIAETNGTTIIFLDFSRQLSKIKINAD